MNVFEFFKEVNIGISWTLIQIGTEFIEFEYRIKPQEVNEYIESLLLCKAANETASSLLYEDDTEIRKNIISKLVKYEDADINTEQRKWILYVVNKAIKELSSPPTADELFELSDIWGYLDMPLNYPWDVKNNEYIKCTDIAGMITAHEEWIEKEIHFLSKGEL